MKRSLIFVLIICIFFTGCSLFDPGEFPEVDVDMVAMVPNGVSEVESESGNVMSALVSTYTFRANSLICFELAYEEAEFSVRCEDSEGNILFSQSKAEPGIYCFSVENGRYKFIMSYELTNGAYTIYAD